MTVDDRAAAPKDAVREGWARARGECTDRR